jgi:hypothetical protein
MQADHDPGLRNSIDDHSDDYKSKNQSCIGVKMFKKVSAVLNFYMRRYKLFKVVLFFFGISLVLSHIRKGIILPSVPPQALSNVTYDHRSFIINGKRQLLIVGAIHYPRSSPGMWPHLFKKTKEAGINAIDTYVFWNLHEPLEGQFDFETGKIYTVRFRVCKLATVFETGARARIICYPTNRALCLCRMEFGRNSFLVVRKAR